jgi:hypothetical protein
VIERIDFIEELLREAETAEAKQRLEVDRLRADQLLAAIAVLEKEMAEANELVDKEIRLLEEYRSNQLARIAKKLSWLVFNLEGFMRSTGEKTIRLPHGLLTIRKGRPRAAIVALEKFLEVGPRLGLVRTVPEQFTPDIQAILNYIKTSGEIPPGIEFLPADTKFSYATTTNGGDDERE